jgi:4'-phosphopantetheinyl transferase EntD
MILYNTQSFFTRHKHELPLHNLALPPNHQFSPKRMAEFSTGRHCALKALEQLEIQDAILPIGDDRVPIWPEGIVGSISHCDSLTGAIVAKSSDHISLGLDIEEIGRVTPDLWDFVFTENEKNYLFCLSDEDKHVQSTAIFSIKEAFYKFQHPITKTFLDFLDVEVVTPNLSKIKVLSNNISLDSIIHENFVVFKIENGCVVSVIQSINDFGLKRLI